MIRIEPARSFNGRRAALMLLLAISILLAVVVSLIVGVVVLLAGALGMFLSLPARAVPATAKQRAAQLPPPRAQLTVNDGNGFERQAVLIHASDEQGYRFVLTTVGYAWVDAEGRIVRRVS